MELVLLYIWLKLPAIHLLLKLGAVSTVVAYIGWIIWANSGDTLAEDDVRIKTKLYPKMPKYIAILTAFILAVTLLPNKTDVAVLVGGHYALKLADTPEASKVMSLIRKTANDMLDEELSKGKK